MSSSGDFQFQRLIVIGEREETWIVHGRTDGLGNVGCPFGGGELVFPVWVALLLLFTSLQLAWLAKARVVREEEEGESGVALQSDRSHFNKTQLGV